MHININEIVIGAANKVFQWKDILPVLVGTVVGGIISALTSFWVTQKSYLNNFTLLNQKEEMETKATIKAIISELKALKQIFEIEFIPKLYCATDYLAYSYPLGTDYFTVFNSNTSKIGKIKNDELRECIVNIYMTAKFFLDSLATNNEILADYENLYDLVHTQSHKQIDILATEKQQQDYEFSIERLKLSKKQNLLPTCDKIIKLFALLDKILEA